MNASQEFALLLWLLTCAEGLALLPISATAFVRGLRSWKARDSATLGEVRGGALQVFPAWPVLDLALIGVPWPLSLGATGWTTRVDLGSARSESKRFEVRSGAWRDLRALEREGRQLRVADTVTVFGSPRSISALDELMTSVAEAPAELREALLAAAVDRHLDPALVRQRIEELRTAFRWSRCASNAQVTALLILAPLALMSFGADRCGAIMILALLGGNVWCVLEAALAAKRSGLDCPSASLVTALLYPPAAAGLMRQLTRDAVAEFHPVAVSLATLDGTARERFLAPIVRDAHHPRPFPRRSGDAACRIAEESNARFRHALDRRIADAGLRLDDILAPPSPGRHDCRSYCPRCHESLTKDVGTCDDCELPTLPLAEAARSIPTNNRDGR